MRASLPPLVQDLFETVRDRASRSAWSGGVELARAEAVVGEHADEDEIVLRVRTAGSVVHPTVILYPQDREWSATAEVTTIPARTSPLRRSRCGVCVSRVARFPAVRREAPGSAIASREREARSLSIATWSPMMAKPRFGVL